MPFASAIAVVAYPTVLRGQLKQISIGARALTLFLGILHGQHAPFGATTMIGEMDPDTALTHHVQDSGQHPHTVEKKSGISGRMDIALHHRAVDAYLAALFDLLLLAVSHQNPVDLAPTWPHRCV